MASSARRRRRLDLRAAGLTAASAIGLVSAAVAAWAIQVDRNRPALLAMAEQFARGSPPRLDLAGRYLDAYLIARPDDVRALGLKVEILAETASGPDDLQRAIDAGDRARRLDPSRRDDRRRLLECYLRLHRLGASQPHQDRAARQLVEGLDFTGPDGPAIHRLAARALAELAPSDDVGALDSAIDHYRKALLAEPGDVESAKALAGLLLDRKGDVEGASAVLDGLIRANPSAEARIARFRHRLRVDPDDKSGRAAAELAEALELKPRGLEIRLVAAEEAIRRGRTEVARRHLDAIGPADRDDPRVWQARGLIGLMEEHADEAVDDWRRSLIGRGGDDLGLAWRLAFVLLSLGRTGDASPLLDRLEALDDEAGTSPANRYLKALRDLQDGRPSRAIDVLLGLEIKAPTGLVPLVANTLGRAFEATGDEASALAAFERAARALPKDAGFRLAYVRSLRRTRPEDAEAELRRALAESPDDPTLRVALARSELLAQAGRPRSSRDWRGFEAAAKKAREVAPAAPALALAEADFLTLIGRPDRATARLASAVRIDRKSADLWAAFGRLLALRGELDEALLVLERGAAPENAGDRLAIRVARARILAQRGRGREAREALIGGLERLPVPQRPLAWAALGDLLDVRGDEADALAAYAEWARLLPEDPAPRLFFLDRALDRGGAEVDRLAREAIDALEALDVARGLFAKVGQALERLRNPSGRELAAERLGRLGRVEVLIADARRLAPGSRWVPLLEGRLREARGRWDEAVATYESGLDRDPGGVLLRRLAAIVAHARDDRILERLAAERPEVAASLWRRAALEALAGGEPVRARIRADRAVAAEPDDLDARLWQARFLELLGLPGAAGATLKTLADAHPDASGPVLARIGAEARLGRSEDARATAAEMASSVATDRPLLASARARARAGDFDAAVVEFDEALDRWPDDPEVAREAAFAFLDAGRPDRAEACLRRALEIHPRPRWASRMLALVIVARYPGEKLGHDLALPVIGEESVDDEPEDRIARDLVLSKIGDPAGRPDAAARAARRIAELPDLKRFRDRLGADPFADARVLAHAEGDRLDDRLRFAHALLDAETARDPGDPTRVIEASALREFGLGEPEVDDGGFLDRLAGMLSGDPGRSARFLDARGTLLVGLGRLGEAADDARRAVAMGRGRVVEPTALFHLARALAGLGRPDEARDALARARRLGLTAESLGPGGSAGLDDLDAMPGPGGGR